MHFKATARGFEPLRAEHNGFLVHHLNHSVTLSAGFFGRKLLCLVSTAGQVKITRCLITIAEGRGFCQFLRRGVSPSALEVWLS